MQSTQQIQRVYYLVISLFWLATALSMPLLVLILQSRGVDLFQIGILMGVYSLTIVLLEVPTGGLADAVGRKRVALLAYSVMLASGLLLLFSFSFPLFLLGFILSGIARALSSGAIDAWFVDALLERDPDYDIQPPLARAGTFTLLALAVGTLVGGAAPRLFARLPAEGTAVLTPFSMTILLSSLFNVILLFVIAVWVKENRPAVEGMDWRKGFGQVPQIVGDAARLSRQNPIILLLLGATLAGGLALATIESFWSPRFASLLGGSEGNTFFFGALLAGSFFFGMVGNLLSIPLSRLLQGRYGLLAAVFQGAQGLFLIVMAWQQGVVLSAAFFWLVYLGLGVLNSPVATLVNQEIPAERRSSMLSVQSLAGYIGGVLGSVVLGYVAKQASISLAWTIAGLLLLVSLVLYLPIDARRSAREKSYDPETPVLETH